jgi:CubicO group peptidase (beta-lactamase class C family)
MADGRPMTTATIVYGASLSKQVVGASLALLARDGDVDPEDLLSAWLPELPAWSGQVRLRHLLHHTSGLPDEDEMTDRLWATGSDARTSAIVIAALETFLDLETTPGLVERYCNAGYVCLGRIVERAAGLPLPEFARSRIFAPLGMVDTLFWEGPQPSPPTAAPVLPDDKGYWPHTVGDGGMWTTVPDLLRWNAALLTDRLGVTTLIHTPGWLDDGSPLTYGWGVGLRTHAGQPTQSHGGGWWGLRARLVRLPLAGRSVAVVALDDDTDRLTALTDRLLDEALAEPGRPYR